MIHVGQAAPYSLARTSCYTNQTLVRLWLWNKQTYQVCLFFPFTGLNPLPFDPATNNEPLQFNSSNGPLLSDCPLENGTENSKKRKRPNLPPGTFNDFLSASDRAHSHLSSPTVVNYIHIIISAAALFLTFECGRWMPGGLLHSVRCSLQFIAFIKKSEQKPQDISTFLVALIS